MGHAYETMREEYGRVQQEVWLATSAGGDSDSKELADEGEGDSKEDTAAAAAAGKDAPAAQELEPRKAYIKRVRAFVADEITDRAKLLLDIGCVCCLCLP